MPTGCAPGTGPKSHINPERNSLMFRKLLISLGAVASLGLVPAASSASAAAPIRECGNFVLTGDHNQGYWTRRVVAGYTPVFNLTTRNVACSSARPFSLKATSRVVGSKTGALRGTATVGYRGYRCRATFANGEDWDIRCTKGRHVIHWQGGA